MKVSVRRQLTIALENTPGRLAQVAGGLAEAGVSIDGVSIIDGVEHGVIRLLTNDPSSCRAVLMRRGVTPVDTDVLCIELDDGPGRLAEVARLLADGGVNIDYAYATVSEPGTSAKLVVKASPLDKAKAVLAKGKP